MLKLHGATWRALPAVALASLLVYPTTGQAAVQYVQICDQNSFYIPGTTTCQDANQIGANQYSVARASSRTLYGIAMATALVAPFIPDDLDHALGFH